jgi:hypothetical protein
MRCEHWWKKSRRIRFEPWAHFGKKWGSIDRLLLHNVAVVLIVERYIIYKSFDVRIPVQAFPPLAHPS